MGAMGAMGMNPMMGGMGMNPMMMGGMNPMMMGGMNPMMMGGMGMHPMMMGGMGMGMPFFKKNSTSKNSTSIENAKVPKQTPSFRRKKLY